MGPASGGPAGGPASGPASGPVARAAPAFPPPASTRRSPSSRGAATTLSRVAEDYWQFLLSIRPQYATFLGDHRYDHRLPDIGATGRRTEEVAVREFLARLDDVAPDSVEGEDLLTRGALAEVLGTSLAEIEQKVHQWDVDQLFGPQVWFLEILNYHPLASRRDYDNFIARMTAYPAMLRQYEENLREGMTQGRVASLMAVDRVVRQIRGVLELPADQHPLAAAIPRIPADWAASAREAMAARVTCAIDDHVRPAHRGLVEFLDRQYRNIARQEVGISSMPGGRETYRFLVRRHTTTALTPEEIHRIGLAEVAGITDEMRKVARALRHRGDVKDFLTAVRNDPANMAGTREQLLERFREDLARAERELPRFFHRLPKAACVVKPLEEFREKDAPAAYYYGPPEDGSRPGTFYANTHSPETKPMYTATSLTAHEAVPGHHLQIALAQEMKHLPAFRRNGSFTAYVEGWALYAERLADEMGLYPDRLSRVGMLTDQCLRACRLVVDTGLHALGWTRDQAIDYMRGNLAMRDGEIVNEVDRYIVWPGQALAYKVGQREIMRLRHDAERALGDAFDLRSFHDVILSHGALPLGTLRVAVEAWIARGRADSRS
jgi:uncharacterized protein (DUF885 family)